MLILLVASERQGQGLTLLAIFTVIDRYRDAIYLFLFLGWLLLEQELEPSVHHPLVRRSCEVQIKEAPGELLRYCCVASIFI